VKTKAGEELRKLEGELEDKAFLVREMQVCA
jgi:hypothetical protein